MFRDFLIFHSVLMILASCDTTPLGFSDKKGSQATDTPIHETTVPLQVVKWKDNHMAAISLTYDSGSPENPVDQFVQRLSLTYQMPLDFELVTGDIYPAKYAHITQFMIHRFPFFGRGHWHIDHDVLSYEDALYSFQRCYEEMEALELSPVAYAYPGGAGSEEETHRALAAAGFLSGRLHNTYHRENPYITPDDIQEPEDWYGLPTLVMQDYADSYNEEAINSTQELIPYLDGALQRRAWLILTYHAIGGRPGQGFYSLTEIQRDLEAIRSRDFWVASMNNVTLYLRERKEARGTITSVLDSKGQIVELHILLDDQLPNVRYTEPLSVKVPIPPDWVGRRLGVFQTKRLYAEYVFDRTDNIMALQPNERAYCIQRLSSRFQGQCTKDLSLSNNETNRF